MMSLQTRVARLERLLSLVKRIAEEEDDERLLGLALESAIEFTDADRGFVLLKDPVGGVRVRAAHNVDRETVRSRLFRPSRAIADRVLHHGEAILSEHVPDDERFVASDSIHEMAAKSILAIPIRARGSIVGVIYLDKMQLGQSAFDSDDLRLLQDFGDVAAVAVEMRRLVREMQAQGDELSRAKAALEAHAASLRQDVAAKSDEIARKERELDAQKRALGLKYRFHNIVGQSQAMLDIFDTLAQVRDYPVPVLITGESGTGKELVARALHHGGVRGKLPFLAINCAAIPENLLESELFGFKRGAFTGANRDKEGLFRAARGGTVFLDEIGEMPASLQGKLLRVLQEKEVMPIGGRVAEPIDARIVSATNRNLAAEIVAGRFREDLYYRLNVVEVRLPSLRERVDDIPVLASHFLKRFCEELGLPARRFSTEALRTMMGYPWHGNVRQLENAVKSSAILGQNEIIGTDDLRLPAAQVIAAAPVSEPADDGAQARTTEAAPPVIAPDDIPAAPHDTSDDGSMSSIRNRGDWEDHERGRILAALVDCGWNKTTAAHKLGFSRRNLYRKLERYGIEHKRR